ncbi:MAG: M50 family metallopeptidase [Planctomyces sp.]|nr:M50 family metallopeptidase [Planctomyces sp.]
MRQFGRGVEKFRPPLFSRASNSVYNPAMYATDSILSASFPAGHWLGVRVRISFLLPVAVMAIMWRLDSLTLGTIGGAILLLSLIIHELSHLIAARLSGGDSEEVILWPLGGLIIPEPGYVGGAVWKMLLAGPAANLLIAAISGYLLWNGGTVESLLNPFQKFSVSPGDTWTLTALRMTFAVNWCLVLLNLIPVLPFDAGHGLHHFLTLRFSDVESRDLMMRFGLVTSLMGVLAGFVFDVSAVTALSAFILVLHIHEVMISEPEPTEDTSFLGYDFSEGYTSLERSAGEGPESEDSVHRDEAVRAGILERWKSRRDEERIRREFEQKESEDRQLDEILAKLHEQGRESLTASELRLLDKVSERLRQQQLHQ